MTRATFTITIAFLGAVAAEQLPVTFDSPCECLGSCRAAGLDGCDRRLSTSRTLAKDRKGRRAVSYEDKETYIRIIAALSETRVLMTEIEETIGKHGGWPKAFAP
jgi:hypothetical protein